MKRYIIGFVLSVLLTLAAYTITEIHINSLHEVISHPVLILALLCFAVLQMLVQIFFFLHLGEESGTRWKLAAFLFTIGLVLIVVVGSLWIMNHLNYSRTPAQVDQYIQDQQGGF